MSGAAAPMSYTPVIDLNVGTVAGEFARCPLGTILHGSRGGQSSLIAEYASTRRYAASGIEIGWNVTVGEDRLSIHMAAGQWGWNARQHSEHYLAVEFAQPSLDWGVTDAQVRAFCWWLQHEVLPVWPGLDVTSLPAHSELPAGIKDGKSDVYVMGETRLTNLRERIAARLAEGGDDLSAKERAELDKYREDQRYWDALAGVILPGALGTIDAAAQRLDYEQDEGARHIDVQIIRDQVAAVRREADL